MTSAQRFAGYPARFGYAAAATMDITDLMAFDLTTNNTKTAIIPAGLVDPTGHLTPRSRPEFSLRTQDMKTVLDVVGIQSGKCFDEDSTFFLQERADCSTFETGTTHPGRRTKNGFMYVDSITAEQDSDTGAVLAMRFIPLKIAANDIVIHVTGLDLAASAPTPAYVQSYFLASPYHNSVEIPGVISVTLNMGITFAPAPSTPGAFDELGSITRREPEFTYRLLKSDEFDTAQVTGDPVNTSFAFYFQKADTTNAAGDGRVAKATAQHIKISFTGGDIETRTLSVDGLDDAVTEVAVRPTGTITYSAASAIP